LSVAVLMLCLFAGCPAQPQVVTVTLKPDTGAGGTAAATSEETPAETAAKGYGNLVGTVTFEGSSQPRPPLVIAVKPEDRAVCAAEPMPDESLEVNTANKGIANVVIFLEKRPANIKPELAKPPKDPVFFDQKGCRFIPHVVAVETGQPLLVISDDDIPHNTHTNPKRNDGFNKVIKPKDRAGTPVNYKKPESAPISVVCDYHPWMKAYHFPIDHPYVAVTDKDGKFKIEGLPAGKHSFNVWHERGPGSSQLLERKLVITIDADKDNTKDLTYGATKFAAAPQSLRRAVAYERLLNGGDVIVTQRESER
jgi:hypothetical protein